jgi:hypothetical protein
VRKVFATARNPEALRALRDDRLVSLRLDVTDVDQIISASAVSRLTDSQPTGKSHSSHRRGSFVTSRVRSGIRGDDGIAALLMPVNVPAGPTH